MSNREFRRRYDRYKRSLGSLCAKRVDRAKNSLSTTQQTTEHHGSRDGVRTPVELWVGVLGSSRKTVCLLHPSQQMPDWIDAHVRAFEFSAPCH